MDYLERDIEDYLVDSDVLMRECGIIVLANQYYTRYGIIDILGYRPESKKLVVIELKKGTVDENAVGQLMRYMAAIQEMQVTFKDNTHLLPIEVQEISGVEGMLMGASATPGVYAIMRVFKSISYVKLDVSLKIDFTMDYKQPDKSLFVKDIQNFVSLIEMEKEQMFSENPLLPT